jgi:hypothetical protein
VEGQPVLATPDVTDIASPLPLLLRESRTAALRARLLLAGLLALYAASQYQE